jgi:uncharacterized coiled-coil DUF342 family protein
MSLKDTYIQKMQTRLREFDKEINKLAVEAIRANAEAKQEYYKQIEELRDKQDVAIEKLETLRQTGDDTWENLKAVIDSAWDDLSDAVKSAASRS